MMGHLGAPFSKVPLGSSQEVNHTKTVCNSHLTVTKRANNEQMNSLLHGREFACVKRIRQGFSKILSKF